MIRFRQLFLKTVICLLICFCSGTQAGVSLNGVLDVYAENRQQGIPNYITFDLLLASYSLIRHQAVEQAEKDIVQPNFRLLVDGLLTALNKEEKNNLVTQSNLSFLRILDALLKGEDVIVDDQLANRELTLVRNDSSLSPSPLWESIIDYSAFTPTGRYAEDQESSNYFQAFRYAGNTLFSFRPSKSTGVTETGAERMLQQAIQLTELINTDQELNRARASINSYLNWQFGYSDGLTLDEMTRFLDLDIPLSEILTFVEENNLKPTIIDGVIDKSLLEDGLTVADVRTGWRFIPSRTTPESQVFQTLVYDSVGIYKIKETNADQELPSTLALINGVSVKAFPRMMEYLSVLGSDAAQHNIESMNDNSYEGYEEAFKKQKVLSPIQPACLSVRQIC